MAKKVKEEVLPEIVTTQSSGKDRGYIFAVGRRKEAVARVRLYPKVKSDLMWGEVQVVKGTILVNGMLIGKYFGDMASQAIYTQFIDIVDGKGSLTATIRVAGGGKAGQLDAALHGLARALSALDSEKYRTRLKQKGYLTRDARERQRRNVGMGGKSRRKRQSPKR